MEELNDNKFDLELRALFENAGEEVPEHIWNAVEKRLDKAGKRRIFPVWLRNTGYVAAAAAILAAVVLTGFFDTHKKQASRSEMIAVVPAYEEIQPAEEISAQNTSENSGESASVPAVRTAIPALKPSSRKYIAQASVSQESVSASEDNAAGQSESDSARPSELPSSKTAIKGKAQKGKLEDPFASDKEQDDKSGIAITFNGNTSGVRQVSGSPSGGPLRAPSLRKPRKAINETGSSNFAAPVSFGIGAKVSLSPKWSIGTGVSYTLLSRTFQGTYSAIGNDGFPGEPIKYQKIRNSQSYIGIPVNVYYSIINNKRIDFYAYAGGTAEKCIDNRYRMAPDVIYKEAVKGFQFSAGGGIGVEFIFGDMFGLYIDPNIRYWFKDDDQPKSIRTQNPLSFGCEIGFRVRL